MRCAGLRLSNSTQSLNISEILYSEKLTAGAYVLGFQCQRQCTMMRHLGRRLKLLPPANRFVNAESFETHDVLRLGCSGLPPDRRPTG